MKRIKRLLKTLGLVACLGLAGCQEKILSGEYKGKNYNIYKTLEGGIRTEITDKTADMKLVYYDPNFREAGREEVKWLSKNRDGFVEKRASLGKVTKIEIIHRGCVTATYFNPIAINQVESKNAQLTSAATIEEREVAKYLANETTKKYETKRLELLTKIGIQQ